ncbi:MAG: 50S ribosomal protein L25 [Gaiellaceae bacterium]
MASKRVKLTVGEREERGSAISRRMRREGFIPGVIYGGGAEPVAITVPERDLRQALTTDHGLHAILDVTLDGSARPAILKEYQRDPITGRVAHVDFVEVRLDQVIQTQISVELIGDPIGVREGGVLQQVAREITVEALPMEVPERIEADISALAIGDSLRLGDLEEIEGVRYVDDPEETVIATVTVPTRVEEPEEVLEEGEEDEELSEEERAERAAEAAAEPDADAAGEPGTAPG